MNTQRIVIGVGIFSIVAPLYLLNAPWWIISSIVTGMTLWELFYLCSKFPPGYHAAMRWIFWYSMMGIILFTYKAFWYLDELFQIIILVSISDILQYFAGRNSTHKIGIGPSPHKTWEGYIGALVTVIGGCLWVPASLRTASMLWILAGICGDLFMSACKRSLKIKDTSPILGAHGGWLDRVDGINMAIIVSMIL